MPNTHCLPTGSLGTGEVPVCNVDAHNTSVSVPSAGIGNGQVRGVIVNLHGLGAVQLPVPPPVPSSDSAAAAFENYFASFTSILTNDGWIFLNVPSPEDYYVATGAEGIYNDVANDSGHGSRYINMSLHWWDHIIQYVHATYGNWPIVAFGSSLGGWRTLQIAANRQSSIVAYLVHEPATIIANINPLFTGVVDFTATNTTGLDISTTFLNSVTIPGCVGYGTRDEAVGYSNPGGGQPVSNTDAMITSAVNAGRPVTRNATDNFHEFTNGDSGTYFTPTGPTALSSLSTLTVNTNAHFTASSGQCAIFASDNLWHTITFTGTTGGNQFTGCSYSGNTAATVSAGAPVCLTGNGTSAPFSYPYWISTVVDPLCPRTF